MVWRQASLRARAKACTLDFACTEPKRRRVLCSVPAIHTSSLISAVISSETQSSLSTRAVWQVNCKLAKQSFSKPEEAMGTYEKGIQGNSRGNDIMIPAGSSAMSCLVSAQQTYMRTGRGSGPCKADENFVIIWEGEGFRQPLILCSSLISLSDPGRCGAMAQWAALTACCLACLASLCGCQVLGSLAHVLCCSQHCPARAVQPQVWFVTKSAPGHRETLNCALRW